MSDEYQAYLNFNERTSVQREIKKARRLFEQTVLRNPSSYHPNALRNGVRQRLIINRSDEESKYNIMTMPGEDLNVGDLITAFDEVWLVTECREGDTINKCGLMWLCNWEFKWQNRGSTEICSSWGVLDSGVFSTTTNGNFTVQYPNEQYNVWLPLNSQTERIYKDKRLAAGYAYDNNDNRVLETYTVTGRSSVSENFGSRAKLLKLSVKSDLYSEERDNLLLGICDYRAPDPNSLPSQCSILGRSTIRTGCTRTYQALFPQASTPVWSCTQQNGVVGAVNDGELSISVANDDSLIGEEIEITLSDSAMNYGVAKLIVEVVSVGA